MRAVTTYAVVTGGYRTVAVVTSLEAANAVERLYKMRHDAWKPGDTPKTSVDTVVHQFADEYLHYPPRGPELTDEQCEAFWARHGASTEDRCRTCDSRDHDSYGCPVAKREQGVER